eukprot:scaffold2960_cov120-Isochrysis_galbana.AAC.1
MLLSDALGAKGACAKTIMLMQVRKECDNGEDREGGKGSYLLGFIAPSPPQRTVQHNPTQPQPTPPVSASPLPDLKPNATQPSPPHLCSPLINSHLIARQHTSAPCPFCAHRKPRPILPLSPLCPPQVSPAASSACESLRTLRFGERCQALEMGAIRRGGRWAAEPPTGDDRVRALQLELSEARSQTKQAEARAMASEARAAAAAAGRQAAPLPVSPLAATLGSATLAQTSRCLSAAQRQQLGLALAQADLGDENRTPNQADLGGKNRTLSGSPARAGRPLSSRPLWAPPQPYQLRHSRSARLPTRSAVVERAAQGGGPADTPRGAVSVPPLERPGSRRGTMLGPRDVSSARQRALLYEAGRFRTFL